MTYSLNSTLLLTVLLCIGLFFFLKASTKDRTTTIEITSEKKTIEALTTLCDWLKLRGWRQIGGNPDTKKLVFTGDVVSSRGLAVFLTFLGFLGSSSLGLVLIQLYPKLAWWPILLGLLGGPLSGLVYLKKARREETFEFRLMEVEKHKSTHLQLRAHRDELIALETELKEKLEIKSDGSLFKTPI